MEDRPNILWLVAEDMSPDLGCYGHPDSITPNLDQLASEGVRYSRAFSFSPVCAPARSCLITGMYPTTVGSHQMRSAVRRPEHIRCFTEYLREEEYYCFNGFSRSDETKRGGDSVEGFQTKFDYNFAVPSQHNPLPAWDAVSGYYPDSRPAHWKNRRPGQPFFGQIGFFVTHESQYGTRHRDSYDTAPRTLPFTRLQEADRRERPTVRVPAYHVDTPEMRELWAQYHECITEMDYQVGEVLAELEKDGLADDTIVFFFGDHGMGVLGGKSWLWDQGLRVPLLVRCPERFRHLVPNAAGSVDERLVSFEDFAPTVLNLAGVARPAHMQGEPFLGDRASVSRERPYVYGARDRLCECHETIRAVRDQRYAYIRNFMPHTDWAHPAYFWKHAPDAFSSWKDHARAGGLSGRQQVFFKERKPVEELYDLERDPDQMHNLAVDPAYAHILQRLSKECDEWMIRTRDLGLLSEYEMHQRAKDRTPYDVGANRETYDVGRVLEASKVAIQQAPENGARLRRLLKDDDGAVRRWAAIGLSALRHQAESALDDLRDALLDSSVSVRISAAEALCHVGYSEEALPTLREALQHDSGLVVFEASWALDRIGENARPVAPLLKELNIKPREPWLDVTTGTGVEFYVGVMADIVLDKMGGGPRRAEFYEDVDLKGMREKFY